MTASAAAVGLGWVLGATRAGRVVARGVAVAIATGAIGLADTGRRREAAGSSSPVTRLAGDACLLDVRIPARDEALVIGDVIADLGRQEPGGGFRLTVIDDRSTDGTGDAALAAIEAAGLGGVARVVRRIGGRDGKAAALAAADDPWRDAKETTIAVLVFDADARVDPGLVARARFAVAGGARMATARRRVRRPVATSRLGRLLVDAQAVEQSADHVLQSGRLAFGGAAELRGNGMLIRTDLLDALGGWPGDALTEDLELSTRIYVATGRGSERPADFDVWEQAPSTIRALSRQRLRWAEGSVRRDLAVVLPALADRTIPLRRRLDVALSAAQDLVPWLGIGLLAGSVARRRSAATAAELAAGYGIAAAALAAAADERGIGWPRRIASLLALGAGWAAILPVAWLRVARHPGRPASRPTPHRPGADFIEPAFTTTAGPRPDRQAWTMTRPSRSGRPVSMSRQGGGGAGR